MTFYQELQLNQAGSKAVIRNSQEKKDKFKHILIYLFKIFITVAFCTVFVMAFGKLFGSDNSIVGVVILLFVLSFIFSDLGISTNHAMLVLPVIFVILAIGPRLANSNGLLLEFLINVVCIMTLMILGCHNVLMFNHSTILLGYLLLYGYDVTGDMYIKRLVAIFVGAVITMVIYYIKHSKKTFKRSMQHLIEELDINSVRTRWQIRMALAISTAILLAGIFNIPRRMWIGIAVMSVTMPFTDEIKQRSKGRIIGNIVGGLLFVIIYFALPESMYSYIGIIGGIGVGLSATYGWQAVFNSLGAMSIAVSILGFWQAIIFRILNNAFGALYGICFEKVCRKLRVE